MVPLISCIMPTGNRSDFALQAVRYFQRQDYPTRQLIIVDDDTQDLSNRLPHDPTIRYVRVRPGLSIGAKRNLACELAGGEIIAQWDDDDWYSPRRLSAQVAPLLAGEADITGLEAGVFFELERWAFWQCTPSLHRRLFVSDVHGGTLVFWRRLWEGGPYPDRSLAEDALFLRQTQHRGARLRKLDNEGLYVYVRHGGNAWRLVCGQYLDPAGWQRVAEPTCLAADRSFYALRSPALALQDNAAERVGEPVERLVEGEGEQRTAAADAEPLLTHGRAPSPNKGADHRPLVTCIMPTANRRAFVIRAIRYFQRQDYPERELLILDDGSEPVGDLATGDPRIRYMRLAGRQVLGAKRNLACEAARGELIVHWDDDDWQAAWRLSYQVAQLQGAGADVCGVDRVWYYQPATGRGWQYVYPPGSQPWVAGNSLCYMRDFWRRNPFPAVTVGEDNRFLWSSQPKRLLPLADNRFLVGLIHPGNTSVKRTHDRRWQPCATQVIAGVMGEDWEFYCV